MTFFFRFLPIFLLVLFFHASVSASSLSFNKQVSLRTTFTDIFFESEQGRVYTSKKMIKYNGKSYLPLREVLSLTNKEVEWNGETNSIHIKSSEENTLYSYKKREVPALFHDLQFDTSISAKGGLVLHANSNQMMYGKNITETFYPASTVKIMTALVAIENARLSDVVTVTDTILDLPSDSRIAHLKPGDQLTLEQLLYALLLYSGNDSAIAIAEHVGGTESNFVRMMNEKAKEIGAVDTKFINPHGYHHEDQFTTLKDLALITKEAVKYTKILEIIDTPLYKAVFENDDNRKVTHYWKTTNQFLKNPEINLPGIIGGKTGFTDASGHNLITISRHNKQLFISIILKGEYWTRYTDSQKIMKKAYEVWDSNKENVKSGVITVTTGMKDIFVNGRAIKQYGLSMFMYNGTTYIEEDFLDRIITESEEVFATGLQKNGGLVIKDQNLFYYFFNQALEVKKKNDVRRRLLLLEKPFKLKEIVLHIIDEAIS